MKEETRPPDAIPIKETPTMDPLFIEPTPVQGSPTSPPVPAPSEQRRRKKIEITEEAREQIRTLHPYYGSREIGRRVGHSRKVVRRALQEMGLLVPAERTVEESKLDPYREVIKVRVGNDLTATRILREIREMGYDGSHTIVNEYVRTLKSERGRPPTRVVKRRFETPMGRELQIDWSPYTVSIAGRPIKVHALGCLLCASRKLFLRFFRDERQSTLLEGLACAFEYFHGLCTKLVLDNMSTAVLGRIGHDRKPLWHPRFLDFTRHYGFEPFACKPKDPDRKGKKEKSFRLVWDDFLKGTSFESWENLDARRRVWLDETPSVGNLRVHGTTRRVPNEAWLEEQSFLIQLPEKRFGVHEDGVRLVDTDSTLSMDGTRYTVPSTLAGRSVAVRIYAGHFEVLDPEGRIAFSRTYVSDRDKGKLQIDKTHYVSVPRRPRVPGGERLCEAVVLRFPSLAPLVQGLQLHFKALAPIHFRALIRLSDRYGQEAFLEAAVRAQQYRRYDALAIERILADDHPLPEDDCPEPLHGLGPALLGEVEPGSLDRFARLDADPSTPAPTDDASPPLTTPETDPPDPKEATHGS